MIFKGNGELEDQLSRTEYKGGTILKIDSKLTANKEGFQKYFRVLGKFYRDNTKILQPPPPQATNNDPSLDGN